MRDVISSAHVSINERALQPSREDADEREPIKLLELSNKMPAEMFVLAEVVSFCLKCLLKCDFVERIVQHSRAIERAADP